MKLVQPDMAKPAEERPEWYKTWDAFVKQLKLNFGDADPRMTARNKIKTLRQSGSALDYWVNFQLITTDLGWDGKALNDLFYDGLKDSVRDELTHHTEPTTLHELKDLAIRLDNRRYQRDHERAFHSDGKDKGKSKDGQDKGKKQKNGYRDDWGRYSSSRPTNNTTTTTPTTTSNAVDMDIDAMSASKLVNGKVSPKEMAHRIKKGLCKYDGCSEPNNCAKLKAKDQAKAAGKPKPKAGHNASVTWSLSAPPDAKNDSA